MVERASFVADGWFDAEQGATLGAGSLLPWLSGPVPLVGRDVPLDALNAHWKKCQLGRSASTFAIVEGETGSGVSRLLDSWSTAQRADLTSDSSEPQGRVLSLSCPKSGGPYRLWEAVVQAGLELDGPPDPVLGTSVLRAAVQEHIGPNRDALADELAYLFGYHSVDSEPSSGLALAGDDLAPRATSAVVGFLRALASRGPLLLVLDDAGLAPRASLAVVGALDAILRDTATAVVLGGGPGLASVLSHMAGITEIRLGPLREFAALALCRGLLTGVELGAGAANISDLHDHIVAVTGGQPLALVSLVTYLWQAGLIRSDASGSGWVIDVQRALAHRLPATQRGVAMARISALSQEERVVLARGAVIGHRFWLGSLMAIERRHLDVVPTAERPQDGQPGRLRGLLAGLEEQQLLKSVRSELPGEEAWAFSAAVYQALAKEMLPETARQGVHATVEQWLALQVGFKRNELLVELANHAEGAGALRRAASYCLTAARALASRYPTDAVIGLLERARELSGEDDAATRWSILWSLGDTYHRAGRPELALGCYRESTLLAWKLRHRGKGAASLAKIGGLETERGNYSVAREVLLSAEEIFIAAGDRAGVAECVAGLGRLDWLTGNLADARRRHQQAGAYYKEAGNSRGVADTLQSLANLNFDRGDLDSAERCYREVLASLEGLDESERRAQILSNLCVVLVSADRSSEAIVLGEQALGEARRSASQKLVATLRNNLGEAYLVAGELDLAATHLVAAVAGAGQTGRAFTRVDASINLARVRLGQGLLDEAQECLEAASEFMASVEAPQLPARLERTWAELMTQRAAQETTDEATRADALKTAAEHYRRAAATFDALGYCAEAQRTRQALGTLNVETGAEAGSTLPHPSDGSRDLT